ncbi:MAG: tetratricopeptide repeat protein [Rhodospirillaceae bacterium]|nr:tetratricopeptide repeat protein [Rhodospirillaceae bacterium]
MTAAPAASKRIALGESLVQALQHQQAGRLDQARALCRAILAAHPNTVDALHILGVVETRAGHFDVAAQALRKAVQQKPDLPEAQINLAFVLGELGQWSDRAKALKSALAAMPMAGASRRADLMHDIGKCFEQLGRPADAAAWFENAQKADPTHLSAKVSLAAVRLTQGRLDEAAALIDAALAAAPDDPRALANLAILRDLQGRLDEVVPILARSLAANPDHVETGYHLALARLARGDFANGWRDHLWRFKRAVAEPGYGRFDLPFWTGEPLAGRRLLVWTEQGPGDELLLGTMLPHLDQAAAHVMLVCSPRLQPLFARAFPAFTVAAFPACDDAVARFAPDLQASLSHLGAALRPAWGAFAASRPYLKADPARVSALRDRYQVKAQGRRIVGVSWRSANPSAADHKSMTLTDLAPFLTRPDLCVVSLQYGDVKREVAQAARAVKADIVIDPEIDALRDMDGFAAQVAAMDRVISVSNTTVHVAGALGVPCRVLVPAAYGRIWYWFLDRADCPWYPSLGLIRQARGERWADTVARTAGDLAAWVTA